METLREILAACETPLRALCATEEELARARAAVPEEISLADLADDSELDEKAAARLRKIESVERRRRLARRVIIRDAGAQIAAALNAVDERAHAFRERTQSSLMKRLTGAVVEACGAEGIDRLPAGLLARIPAWLQLERACGEARLPTHGLFTFAARGQNVLREDFGASELLGTLRAGVALEERLDGLESQFAELL